MKPAAAGNGGSPNIFSSTNGTDVMFSRRHPYLFFLLVSCAICASALIIISLIFAAAFRSAPSTTLYAGRGDAVGIVEVTGVILDSKDVINQIKRFRANDSVKAIVLRVDSSGGSVGPSQEIYREIQKTVGTKKIVASMGSMAASGGYYIAAAADGIMANPGTVTGSIGVISIYTNFEELLEKIGLTTRVIKSGEYKDMGSTFRDMTEAEEKILQDFSDKIKSQFVSAVAEGRDMPVEKVESLADGRIYTGEEAVDHGLVDRLGNLEDAVEWAGRMAGIEGEIRTIHVREKRFSLLEAILGTSQDALINYLSRQFSQTVYLMTPSE